MEHTTLIDKFEKMGARAKVRELPMIPGIRANRYRKRIDPKPRDFRIDVRTDWRGTFFDLAIPSGREFDIQVVDVRPGQRHLLLHVRQDDQKHKFLCGHDERHWFTAAIPGGGVTSVRTAMEALKPDSVKQEQAKQRVKKKNRHKRKNAAFRRQGEWFFIPVNVEVAKERIFKNEALQRSGGKPHMAEFAYRQGGYDVYVHRQHPAGIRDRGRVDQIIREAHTKNNFGLVSGWTVMRRDMTVYVKGKISHSDHKTIVLDGWHRVEMNTEHEAPSRHHVVFLD